MANDRTISVTQPNIALLGALERHAPLALVLTLVAAVYAPSLTDSFHGDDYVAFVDLATRPALTHLWEVIAFQDTNFYWRPLGEAFHFLLYQTVGLNEIAFRAASLAVFIATLCLIHTFCLRAGLGRWVALGAVLVFGLLPNHVVSVAWVTNTSRLLAVCFALGSIVVLQHAVISHRLRNEFLAWCLMLAAALSDETAMALAPLPVLYALMLAPGRSTWPATLIRAGGYGLLVAALLPLQFAFTLDDEPRLASYAFGWHMTDQAWALTSQLVAPIAPAAPMNVHLIAISTLQWVAGAGAIVIGLSRLLFGSWLLRFLLLWIALAVSPFTLWDQASTSPRYVYMAAVPYAVILSWGAVSFCAYLSRFRVWSHRRLVLRSALALVTAAVTAAALGGAAITWERNQAWADATRPYGLLAGNLQEAIPEAPEDSRFVIYYGVWNEFDLWPRVVVQTVYGDSSLDIISVPSELVDSGWPPRTADDIIVFFVEDGFVVPSPVLRR